MTQLVLICVPEVVGRALKCYGVSDHSGAHYEWIEGIPADKNVLHLTLSPSRIMFISPAIRMILSKALPLEMHFDMPQ